MSESTEISIEEAEAIKFADRIMAEYYEIEEKVFALENIELTQFLVDTLKSVIAELEGDSVRKVG